MNARILGACLLMCWGLWTAPGSAAVELNENVPETYTVQKGDTLWSISGIFLQEPWRWPELWQGNPQIDNPHLIFPGDVLYLVYIDGQPRLRSRPGDMKMSPGENGVVKLEPTMRVTPLDLAIPVIPLDEVAPFLQRHRVVMPEDVEGAPYVVAGAQDHLISAPGDRIFARGSFNTEEKAFGIYRQNDIYYDPITKELLGYQAQDIGNAELMSSADQDVVELEVTRVSTEVRITDRLLPIEERILDATFQPRAPDVTIEDGFMIAVDGGVSQIGPLDIVVLNRGTREGLEIGHVLAIYQAGKAIKDPVQGDTISLPDVRAGLLMVFETFEKVSYALVLKANRPLAVLDKVRNP